jgi:outer membrane receptor protein involved in Fe transport
VRLQDAPDIMRWKHFFKATVKFSDNDSFEYAANDTHYQSAGQVTRTRPPETINRNPGHPHISTARWTRTIGSRTVTEARGAYFAVRMSNIAFSGDTTTSPHFDISTGAWSKNIPNVSYIIQDLPQVAGSLAHYADDFIKGSHDFKFGVQVLPNTRQVSNSAFINNTQFFNLAGAPYYALVREPSVTATDRDALGVFAQDNWSVTDRLTFNLGVRYDHSNGGNHETPRRDDQFNELDTTFPAQPDLMTFDNVAARLGVTFKINAKTVAKAGYGRYYAQMSPGDLSRNSPGNSVSL